MEKSNKLKPYPTRQFKTRQPDAVIDTSSKQTSEESVKEQQFGVKEHFETENVKENNPAPLLRVSVDNQLQKSSTAPNTYEFHHNDESFPGEASKSIFEIHKSRLASPANQRPISQSESRKSEAPTLQTKEPSSPLNLLSHHGQNFLPQLVLTAVSETSTPEDSDDAAEEVSISDRANLQKRVVDSKKSRRLYDYRDPAYLEQSRRARRRKRSEVDIEIGLRLSRFVNNPYEGCVDKYSKSTSKQSKHFREQSERHRRSHAPPHSAGNSPTGSLERLIDSHRPALPLYTDTNLSDYLSSKRGYRRRSSSASPSRTGPPLKFTPSYLFRGSVSQNTSPTSSPPTSQGPSSPALNRYRKTTFTTILNSAEREKDSITEGSLPSIYKSNSAFPRASTKTDSDFLSSSLPRSFISRHCERADTFAGFEKLKSNTCSMTKGMNKNGLQASTMGRGSPQTPSPGSLRKHVLLNTSLPTGSPTFQRAMKGFKPEEADAAKRQKEGIKLQEIPQKKGSKPKSRMRTSSASGKRIPYKKSPLTTPSPKSKSHRISFRESPDDMSDDYAETMAEIRDKLGSLDTSEQNVPAVPRKSILKNRRRSIDDLDVGTKKGLAMYLKSKQKENHISHNAHFS